MTAPQVLAGRGLTFQYQGAQSPLFSDLDIHVQRGEIIAVLGPSGVGKSSLLRVLGGLQAPARGEVTLDGEPLLAPHPRVAIAFQDPSLLPWLTLEKNVAFGLDFKRQPRRDKAERAALVDEALREVGLSDFRRAYPSELSGGMSQRAALARCLARRPEVLLLDEPFGALDEVTRREMQALLLQIVADYDTAALLITHDIDEALAVADRIVLLGGAPASAIGQWDVRVAQPRADAIEELGQMRIEILQALRGAVRRPRKDIQTCALTASLAVAC
ncbi:MAG: ABC transporter ATP-binding protein [Beijerinckiaceae bacterium]|nr:ABC transporter ATP-binding protein [Beijerinckiaceae bacterium]